MNTTLELRPLKEVPSDWDALEAALKDFFLKELYFPLVEEIGVRRKTLQNAKPGLLDALRTGLVTFSRGVFSGKFNSVITKELRALGAIFERGVFRLATSNLPPEVRMAISLSENVFRQRMEKLDRKLAAIQVEELTKKLKVAPFFERILSKTDSNFRDSVKQVTIAPQLDPKRRQKIADEWQTNMKLWIKNFTEEEIVRLRRAVQKSAFAGNRFEALIKPIQKSYGVSANKAKFLARQESSLLLTKFKETRYTDAGVYEYRWGCVAGSKNHPVRPWHKKLQGKIFRWDKPPITTGPGEPQRRNNPGQDYNCRCFPVPIVKF